MTSNKYKMFPPKITKFLLEVTATVTIFVIFWNFVYPLAMIINDPCTTSRIEFMRSSLSEIYIAQFEFAISKFVDQDNDQKGEYANLQELFGISKCRGSGDIPEYILYPRSACKLINSNYIHIDKSHNIIIFIPTEILGKDYVNMDEEHYFGFIWSETHARKRYFLFFDEKYNVFFAHQYYGNVEEVCEKIKQWLSNERNWEIEYIIKMLKRDFRLNLVAYKKQTNKKK